MTTWALLFACTQYAVNAAERAVSVPDASEREHAQALQAVKENRLEEALELLSRLNAREPRNARYLFDRVAVLSWAGRHAEARELGARLVVRRDTPAYVLEALAVSARETGDYPGALAVYG